MFYGIYLFIYVFSGVGKKVWATRQESVLSFHYVDPEEQTQVSSLAARPFAHWATAGPHSFLYLCMMHVCSICVCKHTDTHIHTHGCVPRVEVRGPQMSVFFFFYLAWDMGSSFAAGYTRLAGLLASGEFCLHFPSHQGGAGIIISGYWV